MNEKRIDVLRNRIADIGKQQIEYHKFFPEFADNLVIGLGKYLGDEKSVALTTNKNEFDFDKTYRHEGLGFEGGKYRIPIMIKFDNLKDSGWLIQRIWLYCTKSKDCVSVSINSEESIRISLKGQDEILYEKIYEYLLSSFSKENWFEANMRDYKSAGIGFLANIEDL